MPFTLAHPAAVLPLRRYCPKYLSFSALVAGSVVPDAGYCLAYYHLDSVAHSFVGSFTFCLPLGLLMMACLHWARLPVVKRLPARLREIYLPLCGRPFGAPHVVILSILIGAWLHQIWDSFTHVHGWLVESNASMQIPIFKWGYRTFRVARLLWYVSSFVGVAALCLAYERWLEKGAAPVRRVSLLADLRNALVVGVLVVPIEALHDLIHGLPGVALVGFFSLALLLGVVFLLGNGPKAAA